METLAKRSERGVPRMPKANPQVYMELSINGRVAGRIVFELFATVVPQTAENFRALCTGERGRGLQTKKLLHLKNTRIYRIVGGFVAQGGDLANANGLVGESVYGGTFRDENFERKHNKRGLLKHVVFGEAISGVELLSKLEAVSGDNGRPSHDVLISDCGQVDTNTQNQLQGIEEARKRSFGKNEDESSKSGSQRKRKRGSPHR